MLVLIVIFTLKTGSLSFADSKESGSYKEEEPTSPEVRYVAYCPFSMPAYT